MKKKFLVTAIIAVAFIILNITTSKAATYNKGAFSITLPNSYNSEIDNLSNKILVQTSDTRRAIGLQASSGSYSLVINDTYMEELANEFTKKSYKVKSKKLIEHNSCKGVRMELQSIESNTTVYTISYNFISDNYSYMLLFMSVDSNGISASDENAVYNSFKIKDTVKNSNGIPFTDVSKSNWSYSAVKYAYENKVMSGTNSYTFAPNDKVTRGMLVTMLHNMEKSPYISDASNFSDVQNSNEYYYMAVKWAAKNKIVSGYSNGKFGPNDPITREQLAVILNQYCNYKGKYKAVTADFSRFKDSNKISSYAKWGMNWAVGNKIINGSNGVLNPQGTATRAEAAAMISNYCKTIK